MNKFFTLESTSSLVDDGAQQILVDLFSPILIEGIINLIFLFSKGCEVSALDFSLEI